MGTRRRESPGRPALNKPWKPSPQQLELYADVIAGKTIRETGAKFGISRTRVNDVCMQIDRYLFPIWMDRVRFLKSRHSELLMVIFREAMDAWQKSKLDAESISEKLKTNGENKTETTKHTEGQSGNPRHLEVAMKALQDIRKIWGADAPIELRFQGELRVAGKSIEEANRELMEEMAKAQNRLIVASAASGNPGEN